MARQRLEVGNGTRSSTWMDRLVDEAELDHRAIGLDEARIRGAARRRQRRRGPSPPAPPPPSIDQRPGLRQENVARA